MKTAGFLHEAEEREQASPNRPYLLLLLLQLEFATGPVRDLPDLRKELQPLVTARSLPRDLFLNLPRLLLREEALPDERLSPEQLPLVGNDVNLVRGSG